MIITRRLYDEVRAATEAECRADADKLKGGKQGAAANFGLAWGFAGHLLRRKHKISPSKAQRTAAQIATELTAAGIGDWIEAVTIVDDGGALDVLRLGPDADAETIRATHRRLVNQLEGKPGGEVMLAKIEAAFQQPADRERK